MILDFHRQGLTVAAIARETGRDCRDRKTVRKHIARGLVGPELIPIGLLLKLSGTRSSTTYTRTCRAKF